MSPAEQLPDDHTCPFSEVADNDCDQDAPYRSYDGSCNNLRHPLWGRAMVPLLREVESDYDDGITFLSSTIPSRTDHGACTFWKKKGGGGGGRLCIFVKLTAFALSLTETNICFSKKRRVRAPTPLLNLPLRISVADTGYFQKGAFTRSFPPFE